MISFFFDEFGEREKKKETNFKSFFSILQPHPLGLAVNKPSAVSISVRTLKRKKRSANRQKDLFLVVLKSFRRVAASTNIYIFLLGFLQRKVDEIARLSETRRKEQERNFRLVSLEKGSSHRGTVGGALACHLVRVPVWTL